MAKKRGKSGKVKKRGKMTKKALDGGNTSGQLSTKKRSIQTVSNVGVKKGRFKDMGQIFSKEESREIDKAIREGKKLDQELILAARARNLAKVKDLLDKRADATVKVGDKSLVEVVYSDAIGEAREIAKTAGNAAAKDIMKDADKVLRLLVKHGAVVQGHFEGL